MGDLLVRAWQAAGPLQGWLAWRLHARFGVGVTGIVRAQDGRVLLLRHRLWRPEGQWGFPSGFAQRGEAFQDTVVREVREETGLTVRVGRLLELRSGFRYRVEAYYEAALVGGVDGLVLDDREIIEARPDHPRRPSLGHAAAAQGTRETSGQVAHQDGTAGTSRRGNGSVT